MARKLEVEIVGDASSLNRALGQAQGGTGKFGANVGKLSKLAVVGLAAVGVGAAVAGKKLVDMASDAAEVQSKFEVIFGKQVPKMTRNINAFAKATGASKFELKAQVADMGALLKPLLGSTKAAGEMSINFTKLATDLGSFNNVPTSEALLAIRSGLVGEAEPLRKFGVLLNENAVTQEAYRLGIAKTGEALTEQEKVQARASLIMKQTKLAQGDATRTAGSMANQMKRLKNEVSDAATELGMKLIPVALKIVTWFNEHWPEIQKVTAQVFSAISKGVAVVAGFFQKHWGTIRATTILVFDAIRAKINEAIAFYQGSVAPAIQNVLAAIRAYWDRFGADIIRIVKTAFQVVQANIKMMIGIISGIIKFWLAILRGDWSGAWNAIKQIVSSVMTGIVSILRGLLSIFATVAKALGNAIKDGIVSIVSTIAGKVKDKLGDLKGAIEDIAGKAAGWAEGIGRAILSGIKDGIGDLWGWIKSLVRRAIAAALPFGGGAGGEPKGGGRGSQAPGNTGNPGSGRAIGGGSSAGVSVTFNGPVYGDARSIAQAVREEFVRMQRNGSKLGFT